jgi:hypothetical protein
MIIPSAFVGTSLYTAATGSSAFVGHVTTSSSLMLMKASSEPNHDGNPSVFKFAGLTLPVALAVVCWGARAATAAAASNAVPVPTHFLTNGVLDIGRVKMRLEGFQAYGTICALLMNASLRLWSSVAQPANDASKITQRAFDVFLLCVIVSVLFGSYTTIVFTMISLYSKQALGRGLDSSFLAFYEATHAFRDSGFRAFLYSLVSFQWAFVLSLFLKLGGQPRQKWMVGAAIVLSCLSGWRWLTVMKLASDLIYAAQSLTL